jgi:phospholipid/cholesterol/gamma-HCH transport system substrate-binding protein
MPRTRSLVWSELKVGVLAIVAMVIAAVVIFALGVQGGFFWQRYHLKARFANSGGVKSGSVVRVAGVDAGRVTDVQFAGAEVEMTLELSRSMQPRVRTTSVATIGSVSLLGEGAVDITARTDGDTVPDWGYVRPGPAAAQLADVASQATKGMEDLNQILQKLRMGQGTAGRILSDERLYTELTGFITSARAVTEGLQKGNGTLGTLLKDPKAARELESSLKSLSGIMQRIDAGEGGLGRLVRDESLAKSLSAAVSNLDSVTGRIARGEGTLGKLSTDSALYERLSSLTARFDQLAERLNAGQGTAGQLLQDRQLYENMNKAVGELQGLIADIRKDPRKYLSVKVSIF